MMKKKKEKKMFSNRDVSHVKNAILNATSRDEDPTWLRHWQSYAVFQLPGTRIKK